MSAHATTPTLSAPNRGQAGIGQAVRNLLQGWRNAIARRQAYNNLLQLDDRMLADIGMVRGTVMARLIEAERLQGGFHLRDSAQDWLQSSPAVTGRAANSDDRSSRAA